METAPTRYVIELSCEIDALTARMALSDLGELLSRVGKSPHTKVVLVSIEGYDRVSDGIDNPHPVKHVANAVDAIYDDSSVSDDHDDWGPLAKISTGDAHFHDYPDSPCYAKH